MGLDIDEATETLTDYPEEFQRGFAAVLSGHFHQLACQGEGSTYQPHWMSCPTRRPALRPFPIIKQQGRAAEHPADGLVSLLPARVAGCRRLTQERTHIESRPSQKASICRGLDGLSRPLSSLV